MFLLSPELHAHHHTSEHTLALSKAGDGGELSTICAASYSAIDDADAQRGQILGTTVGRVSRCESADAQRLVLRPQAGERRRRADERHRRARGGSRPIPRVPMAGARHGVDKGLAIRLGRHERLLGQSAPVPRGREGAGRRSCGRRLVGGGRVAGNGAVGRTKPVRVRRGGTGSAGLQVMSERCGWVGPLTLPLTRGVSRPPQSSCSTRFPHRRRLGPVPASHGNTRGPLLALWP